MNTLKCSCLGIDHIHFYVDDLQRWRSWYEDVWGFQTQGQRHTADTDSIWLSQFNIDLILSQSRHGGGEVAEYRRHHPQGVADVALRIRDADRMIQQLQQQDQAVTLLSHAPGLKHYRLRLPGSSSSDRDLCHSLIERQGKQAVILPGFEPLSVSQPPSSRDLRVTHIDHLVLNVGVGQSAAMSQWYEQIFGWQPLYRYTIATQRSGLRSVVLGDPLIPAPPIQLAINEPTGHGSQIQEFIEANQGPGIQHVALHTPDIVRTVARLRQRGISFLQVPADYYQSLPTLPDNAPALTTLAEQQLLVDTPGHSWDAQESGARLPLLLQTFTQPLFAEPTFFYEVIQRCSGACGFGEDNFHALFAALERQQLARQF